MDIIVLAGGLSTERDVSFGTGNMVSNACLLYTSCLVAKVMVALLMPSSSEIFFSILAAQLAQPRFSRI